MLQVYFSTIIVLYKVIIISERQNDNKFKFFSKQIYNIFTNDSMKSLYIIFILNYQILF